MTGLVRRVADRLRGDAHDRIRYDIGAMHARHARAAATLHDAEFRTFSQFGEDGIIQWLIARVPIDRTVFVEFGVEDYRESNTRFLVQHDNWAGLILDAGSRHQDFVRRSGLAWRHTLDARSAFITAENINGHLADVAGDVGLLSIDIDGNDYWVWNAIQAVSARIVVVEYNSVLGSDRAVTVPYDRAFNRRRAHWSDLYGGASLRALCNLASTKGYTFAGSNTAGTNAFFVREDCAAQIPGTTVEDGWVPARVRVSRDRRGRLSLIGPHERQRAVIAEMPLIDVATGERLTVGDL